MFTYFCHYIGNVSTCFVPWHFIVSFKMWIHLHIRMFPYFRHCIGMYPHFSQGILLFLFRNVDTSLFNDVSIFSSLYGNVSIFLARAFYCFTSKYGFISI